MSCSSRRSTCRSSILLTLGHIGEIVDRSVQPQSHGREDGFPTPCRRDGLGSEFLRTLCSHLLLETSNRGELGAEVREHLAKTSLGKLGDIDGAEAVAKIVEAVAPLADLRRDKAKWILVLAHPPIHTLRWSVAHV